MNGLLRVAIYNYIRPETEVMFTVGEGDYVPQ